MGILDGCFVRHGIAKMDKPFFSKRKKKHELFLTFAVRKFSSLPGRIDVALIEPHSIGGRCTINALKIFLVLEKLPSQFFDRKIWFAILGNI